MDTYSTRHPLFVEQNAGSDLTYPTIRPDMREVARVGGQYPAEVIPTAIDLTYEQAVRNKELTLRRRDREWLKHVEHQLTASNMPPTVTHEHRGPLTPYDTW